MTRSTLVRWMVGVAVATWLHTAVAQMCPDGQFPVTSEGFAAIVGDVGAAQDEARRDALRLAVEQAVGVVIESSTLVVNYELVEDEVRTRSEGYVASHTVVERVIDASSVRVVVEACVDPRELRADLETFGAVLREQLGNPRIVVLADAPEEASAGAARRMMEGHLAALGFDVRLARGDECDAGDHSAGVELVLCITVDGSTTPVPRREGLYSSRASVALEALLGSTGQVVARGTGAAPPQVSVDPQTGVLRAVELALGPLLDEVTLQLTRGLNAEAAGIALLELVVHGLPDFAAFNRVESLLRGLRGVQYVDARGFVEGRGTFAVQGTALASDIARRLEAEAEVRLRVTRVETYRVEAEALP